MSPVRAHGRPLALVLAAGLAASTGAPGAPLEGYGRLPHLENVALSPDGSRVAFIRTEGDTRVIGIMALESGQSLGRLRAGDEKVRSIDWADNDHLMITTTGTSALHGLLTPGRDEWRQLQIYDLKSNRAFMVPEQGKFSDLQLVTVTLGAPAVRRVKDRTVLFVRGMVMERTPGRGIAMVERAPVIALLRVDLDTRAATLARRAQAHINEWWTIDENGEVVAEETYDQANGHWSISTDRAGQMREALSGDAPVDRPELMGMGPVAGTVLLQRVEEGDSVWRLITISDGSVGPALAERRTLDRPIEERISGRMIGGVHVADSDEYVFFDPGLQQRWQAVMHAFHDERLRFESASADFQKFIVRVEGERDGFCFALVDLGTHRAEPLGDVYQGLGKPYEVRRINYTATDGLQIPAYVTLPRGKPAQKLALVVLPHGGPAARDTADFDWWAQAFADQGYAVLQPNFRGSAIDWAFISKGFGEWGRKMQSDLSDGVRYLANEGLIDAKRVCILGASYGGYAALAGASLEPGIYRCAVALAGISDLRSMVGWIDARHRGYASLQLRNWNRYLGITGGNDASLDAISPIRHVDAISVPVLLLHGRDDTVVPFEQSQMLYDALRKQNKEVQLVTLDNEDHWLSRSATRLQALEAAVAFVRAHNPPD
jgi:dienelactone hydrolase